MGGRVHDRAVLLRWSDLRVTLTDLVLPAPCAGCGATCASSVCRDCLAALCTPRPVRRQAVHPPGLPRVFCLSSWEGPARQLVLAHKERGRTGLAAPLGRALAPAAVLAAGAAPVLLVPMPSRPAVRRARGHDPVGRTASVTAATLRADGRRALALPLLRHVRTVRDQAGLTATQRAQNLAGALSVRTAATSGAGWPVLLVDDVLTTGATLAEAARALRAAGRTVAGAVVIAAVEHPGGGLPGVSA